MDSAIARVDLYRLPLSYVGGEYVMSGGRVVRVLDSTIARVQTAGGVVGWGETCPLGRNYLPAHAAGARATLEELAPSVLGLDAANPAAVSAHMDRTLSGHDYAKSALDVACWDAFGRTVGRPVCDLIGGRRQASFELYVAIPLGAPAEMAAAVERFHTQGVHRFQLKLGGDPHEDAERARAVIAVAQPGDVVIGDANRGWSLAQAVTAVRLLDGLPGLILEQPCDTLEECLQVRARTTLPLLLDECITDVPSLLRAHGAIEGFNLKVNRAGGITKARLLRDVGAALGMTVNIEDSWGGDIVTAAVSHLAASTPPGVAQMVSFMNDWVNEHVAGHEPRSVDGIGRAPEGPGLGITVDEERLGAPFASFGG